MSFLGLGLPICRIGPIVVLSPGSVLKSTALRAELGSPSTDKLQALKGWLLRCVVVVSVLNPTAGLLEASSPPAAERLRS